MNCLAHDILLVNELKEVYGHYETFTCYKRVVVKFAVDLIEQANRTDYLTTGPNVKPSYRMTESSDERSVDQPFLSMLMSFLDTSSDEKFKALFFNAQIWAKEKTIANWRFEIITLSYLIFFFVRACIYYVENC